MRKSVIAILVAGVATIVFMLAHFGSTKPAMNESRPGTVTTPDGERDDASRSSQAVVMQNSAVPGATSQHSIGGAVELTASNAPATVPPANSTPVMAEAGTVATPQKLAPGVPYRAPPTEATVVEEEDENGVVTKNDTDPADDRTAELQNIVQNPNSTSSGQLVQLFDQGQGVDDKNEILSYATQVPSDLNTRILLQLALYPSQSAELRQDAVTYAADQEPDLLLSYVNDPTLGIEIQSLLNGADSRDASTTVSGADSHPPLGKTAIPPANANQVGH